jgi:hypothetical protein
MVCEFFFWYSPSCYKKIVNAALAHGETGVRVNVCYINDAIVPYTEMISSRENAYSPVFDFADNQFIGQGCPFGFRWDPTTSAPSLPPAHMFSFFLFLKEKERIF